MVVVIDCNIWISLSINGQIDFIADLSDKGIIIATCFTLRSEIFNVLKRPKLSKFITYPQIDKVIELHDLVTTNYTLSEIPNIVTDAKDNYLFALAGKATAEYLVTGDKLLLDIKEYQKRKLLPWLISE